MVSYPAERAELAAALRWAARLGFQEGVDNHFSLAVPDADDVFTGNTFLVNPYGLFWSEITASSLVLCDGSGTVIEGDHEVETTAFFIHAPMHAAQVKAVLHTHMPYATALTLTEARALDPTLGQGAMRYVGRIAVDTGYNGLALDWAEGERIAAAMQGKDIAFLGNHGVIVAGACIAHAYDDLYYLERACMLQVLAMSTGRALAPVNATLSAHVAAQIQGERQQSDLFFQALRRMLG
jgi:ribulose-5-phosphate 4-epimerase/fuculose-1-phosphate aldolase